MSSILQRKGSKKEEDADAEFLDADEQDQVIENFRVESEKQNKWFRRALALVLSLCALMMLFCLASFVFYPYSMFIHEVYFQDILSPLVMYCFYTCSALMFAGSAAISLNGSVSLGMPANILLHGLAIFNMLFWLWVFYDLEADMLSLYWMPFGNITCLFVSAYVDKDMNSIRTEVDKLSSKKYDYKKI